MIPLIFTILAQEYPLQLVALMCLSVLAVLCYVLLEGEQDSNAPMNNVGVWLGWIKKIIREWVGGGDEGGARL